MRNAKGQFQLNKAFWRLEVTTGTSREFELQANYLARLEVLSYSATTSATLQLPFMLHTCATFGNSPVARSTRKALLELSSLSLAHYLYIILT